MFKLASFVFLFALLFSCSLAATVQWTGGAGNSLWSFATNWNNNAVPTANDDVVINALGGASVSVSQPAVAQSVTIAGGSYPQTLTLLSQLSVGSGGIAVNTGGILNVQSNTDLPLSSTGPVVVQTGSTLNFQSGSLNGPGTYTISNGAVLLFSQASLKQIASTTISSYGQVTIQSSTLQFSAGGSLVSYANLTAVGGIQVLSDNSATSFEVYGNFVYEGQLASQPLVLQVPTVFGTDLNIDAGAVQIADDFKSNQSVVIPAGSSVTVNAGQYTASLNVIKGIGSFVVSGTATLSGPASLASLFVTDSGTLTLNTGASFTTIEVGGKLLVQSTLSATNLTLAGGNIAGPGTTSVSGYLLITQSDTTNNNNFISSNVILYGQGSISEEVYLLFGDGGILHVANSGNLNILAQTNFGLQSGSPLIIIDGTISVTLNPSTATIVSNVNIQGAGTLKVNAGIITFNGNTITLGALFLAVDSFVNFETAVVTINAITGSGGFNLTAAPQPVSTLGTIALSYIGFPSGTVNVASFAVSTIEIWNSDLQLGSGSSSSTDTVNFYGGRLDGPAKLSASSFNIIGTLPIFISGIAVKTGAFSLQTPGITSIQTSNGTTIVTGSSSYGVQFN